MESARHGDLVFSKISKKPKGKGLSSKSHILARGEHTGHKHVIKAIDPNVMINVWKEIDSIKVEVKGGRAELTHEEHKPIIFIEGLYEMKIKREYDPFLSQIRQVQD